MYWGTLLRDLYLLFVMEYHVLFFGLCESFHSMFFFFKQKTAYEMRISDWSSDVCSSDLLVVVAVEQFLEIAQIVADLVRRNRGIFPTGMRVLLAGNERGGTKPRFANFPEQQLFLRIVDRKSTRLNSSH